MESVQVVSEEAGEGYEVLYFCAGSPGRLAF